MDRCPDREPDIGRAARFYVVVARRAAGGTMGGAENRFVRTCPFDYAAPWQPWSRLSQLDIWFQLVKSGSPDKSCVTPQGRCGLEFLCQFLERFVASAFAYISSE